MAASPSTWLRKNPEILQKEIENGRELVGLATNGDLEGVRALLEAGVSVNAAEYNRSLFYKSQNYLTPLMCAAKEGHAQCVKLLIEYGADLNACNRFDITAVHLSAENGQLACLQLLLDAGADCNMATKYSKHGSYTAVPHIGGTTALHLATTNNNTMCVRELILNGADYNATDGMGRTSLYIASEKGFEDAVLVHLRNAVGRDILSLPVKGTGETPLHECVKLGLFSCVIELLQHGSSVNHLNQAGFSSLHLAVTNTEKFTMDIVKELVLNGYNTDVNLKDSTGLTPLHYACFGDNCKQERRPQLAAFLIAYGARFENTKNKHGNTLLLQELRVSASGNIILKAILRTMSRLPSLESLGVWEGAISRRCNTANVKLDLYQSLFNNPRSLQHYCRCIIRRSLDVMRLKHINGLPLPTTLKEFLLLDYGDP